MVSQKVSFRLGKELYAAISDIAYRYGVSRAMVVDTLLWYAIRRNPDTVIRMVAEKYHRYRELKKKRDELRMELCELHAVHEVREAYNSYLRDKWDYGLIRRALDLWKKRLEGNEAALAALDMCYASLEGLVAQARKKEIEKEREEEGFMVCEDKQSILTGQ